MISWFLTPVPLTGWEQLLLLLPLCLSLSIVYKATRLENLREVPIASVITWGTIVAGMFGVGVGLYVLQKLIA